MAHFILDLYCARNECYARLTIALKRKFDELRVYAKLICHKLILME